MPRHIFPTATPSLPRRLDPGQAIVLHVDDLGHLLSCSASWTSLTGFSRASSVGRTLSEFATPEAALMPLPLDPLQGPVLMELQTKSGETRNFELHHVAVPEASHRDHILLMLEVTSHDASAPGGPTAADIDHLTGLLSLSGIYRHLMTPARTTDYDLIVLELDQLKQFNANFGSEAGDALLKTVATRIRNSLGSEALAARISGETFAIVRPAERSSKAARLWCEALCHDLETAHINTPDGPLSPSLSIGISHLAKSASLKEAVKWAQLALQEAKLRGGNAVEVADDALSEQLRRDGKLIRPRDIIAALEAEQISQYVQPIWDTRAEEIIGFEALIRWDIRPGKTLPPSQFLAKFQTLTQTPQYADAPARLQRSLLRRLTACPGTFVSFNIQLDMLGYPGAAHDLLAQFPSQSQRRHDIVLEICEAAIRGSVREDLVTHELAILRDHGMRIALDDFGKESSNLHRLIHLPVDIVKIDKSLVDRIMTDARAREVLRSIAHLSDSLSFDLIAEGVETQAQRILLMELGLIQHQGFLYARPMPAEIANRQYSPPPGKNLRVSKSQSDAGSRQKVARSQN
nr:bifunctional diguanylate cyclase/phosphodiesterase [uncultured Celeribacter sp.]